MMYGEMVLKEGEGAITGLLLIFLENQIPAIYVIFFPIADTSQALLVSKVSVIISHS